jgi:hypothetical protein
MRDLTNSLKRQLQEIAKKTNLQPPRQITLERLLRIFAGEVEPTPEEQAFIVEHKRHHELNYDPPDCVDRLLAREMAELDGQPDPYGCDGLSDSERRARDWADYRENGWIS